MKIELIRPGLYKCTFKNLVTFGPTRTKAMIAMMQLVRDYSHKIIAAQHQQKGKQQ